MSCYNLESPIKDVNSGQNFKKQVVVDLQVQDVIRAALLLEPKQPVEDGVRVARGVLAERLGGSGCALNLSEKEIQLIKDACGAGTPIPFLAAIKQALETPVTPKRRR